jgi:hypothetical protein
MVPVIFLSKDLESENETCSLLPLVCVKNIGVCEKNGGKDISKDLYSVWKKRWT